MTDQNFVIELDEDDTEGHGLLARGIVEPDDSQWLEEKLRSDSGKRSFRISVLDEDGDTEGHGLRGGPVVRVSLDDEDDTEGHAIAIHFPSLAEADAFRRRLMVTGVLVGTVALGAAGGVGLSALQSDTGADAGPATTQSQAYANYQEAAANEGARQGAGAAQGAEVAPAQTDPRAHVWAPIEDSLAPSAADAQAYANYQEAAANEAARQGGGSATTQVGPLDAHEAPAFQQSATSVDVDRDIGIMDGSGAAAATQVGPLDAHEAPAFQQSTQVGPLDAHEAPAFQSGAAADEGSSELNDIGGPTPK
jgi:hypothetical protein